MNSDPISALVQSVARSDRAAFRQLYAAAGGRIMGVLLRMLGDRAEAEEALKEVFNRIWLAARGYDPARETGIGWLIGLARADALDRLRARGGAQAADGAPRLPFHGEGAIADCLDRLAPERAEAIRRAYLDGVSAETLGDLQGTDAGGMGDLLRESLMQIRECLGR